MSSSSLLESFREAYRNLQLLPLLEPEELARFRVDYGARVMAELEQVVEDCSPVNNKVIFAGHRGCGKSTLLAEFGRRLSDRYFVVFFSIADMIEMSDVNHINILFAIAVQMMDKAEREKIKIKKSTKEAFYKMSQIIKLSLCQFLSYLIKEKIATLRQNRNQNQWLFLLKYSTSALRPI